MTAPELALTDAAALDLEVDLLVFGTAPGPDGAEVQLAGTGVEDGPTASALRQAAVSAGATGGVDELVRVPFADARAGAVAFVGLGSTHPTAQALRYAAGTVTRQTRGVERLGLALPAADADQVRAALEGAALGAYEFTEFRSVQPPDAKRPVRQVLVRMPDDAAPTAADPAGPSRPSDPSRLSDGDGRARIVLRAETLRNATALVRDLVNTPPSHLYPETFASRAAEAVADLPIELEVLDEQALADGGYGGIAGVGQGSTRPPRLVVVRYRPSGAAKHLALVGKGITFDSGGLSLKPPASMVGMKYDMTGAATVLAVVVAAARLGLPVEVSARLCLAENLPSGSAIRPNDVLVMRGGTTVEVLNTDAEGRLVMADGLVDASAEHPDALIDVATLTGAQRVALGTRTVGVMGDDALAQQVVDLADEVGETMWRMPLPSELRALLNSDVADIANAKPGNTAAGMLLAGVFLREFVGRASDAPDAPLLPWAHLDIAGPATNEGGGYGFTGRGPTAVAVRTLLALAERMGSE